jgi:hypothetical protein
MRQDSQAAVFRITAEGYFARGKQRVVPFGVNYWPSSCGLEMWQAWPATEIQRDLDLVRSLGMNCVRFFLRWEDFEPEAGRHDPRMWRRLAVLLGWFEDRGLMAMPSLFVGWMSGGIFWPRWKGARNLFCDAGVRARALAFASKAAEVCGRFRETVLAIDQGNELCCLPECMEAPPADVERWCAGVNTVVRRRFPGVLLISGNEQNQVIADTGWRFGAQPGCDLYSMHTYPVSAWHALGFDGMTDPLAQSLFPFYLKCARAWGPVMMQEFGTLFTAGNASAAYLRAMLPAAWAAGANGFLWWSLRDIDAGGHPYEKNAFEGPLGLVTASGNGANAVKPTLRCFAEFGATLATLRTPTDEARAGDIALYWPKHFYARADPANPGNEPRALSRRMAVAHFGLTQVGRRVGVVRAQDVASLRAPMGRMAGTIVVTGAALTKSEAAEFVRWVRTGGRLVLSGVDAMNWGVELSELVGAEAGDFLAGRVEGVRAFGATWSWSEMGFARGVLVGVVPLTAKVLARDRRGRPVLLRNRIGRGRVLTCLAMAEESFAAESAQRDRRARWLRWYRGVVRCVDAEQ